MVSDALIAAPIILAAVLLASAIGTLRTPGAATTAFQSLDVPDALRTPLVVRAHPWVEVALAVLLLVSSDWLGIVVGIATLVLFLAYLVLIWRAYRADDPVDCNCFGGRVASTVTGRTVWRNVWFVALAILAVLDLGGDTSVVARFVYSASIAGWVLALAAAAATVVLVTGTGALVEETPGSAVGTPGRSNPARSDDEDALDYERTVIPHVPVLLPDGTSVPLVSLIEKRPQLLVAVSLGCSPCQETLGLIPTWREQLPLVDIHPVFNENPRPDGPPGSLYDPVAYLRSALRLSQTPSAVLLGVDGLLAGGPEYGVQGIAALVEAMREELDGVSAPADAPGGPELEGSQVTPSKQ